MSKSLEAMQAELELKQKELDLTFAIDHIRDTILEPSTMLANIVNILANELETDLCLLILVAGLHLKGLNRSVTVYEVTRVLD